MKRYIKSSVDSSNIDDAIKKAFGSDSPSTGCSFIARDGKFINIYPKLDVHEDLCYWVTDNLGVEIKYPDEEYFINAFGYIRLRSDPNMMIIELPEFAPSNSQWYSLQDWLDYCQEKYRRRVTLDISVYGSFTEVNVQYDFGTEYFSEDIIKVLKRYYSSGKLYASTNKGGHMKRYIRSSKYAHLWEKKWDRELGNAYIRLDAPDGYAIIESLDNDGDPRYQGYVNFSTGEQIREGFTDLEGAKRWAEINLIP